jgi:hypothetical protein
MAGKDSKGPLTCLTEDVPKAQLRDSDSDPARPISASIGAAHASGVASLAWRRSCAQLLWSQSFSPQWCWPQPMPLRLHGARSMAAGRAAAKTADFRRWSNVWPKCGGLADGADPIRSLGQHSGPGALGGRVRRGSTRAAISKPAGSAATAPEVNSGCIRPAQSIIAGTGPAMTRTGGREAVSDRSVAP